MWFKNLVVYRLGAWSPDADALEEKLAQKPLQKCGGYQMESLGWVAARPTGEYLYNQNRQWLLALGYEQKLLPSTVIRQEVEERALELEAKMGHPIGRKQKRDLKEQVTAELMPRALSKRRTTYAWIDTVNGWLAVDAAGAPRAEQFLEVLRKTEDGLPLRILDTQMSPSTAMTQWIMHGEAPGRFGIDQDLELRLPDASKATVRYSRHNLEGKDIRDHLAAGKQLVKLGLTWNDRISFVLTEELHVKRLAFLDVLEKEAGQDTENEDEQFEVNFALMTGELSRMLTDLVAVLGGEKDGEPRPLGRDLEASVA